MTDTSPPDDLRAALAARYRITRVLGAGGMATVYVAHDLAHDREVALKVLRPELGSVLGAERFLAEIKVTARLSHPHIVTVLDSGEAAGFLYYVLPLIRGQSLRDRMHQAGRLGVAEAVKILDQVAGALDYAHRQGIIHRDIKPENILLHEGEAMLSDFGIALAVSEAGKTRLTSSGISLGTPLYMSPEQASGSAAIGPASDQFSLAAMAYEMLSGETPHAGATTHAIMARLLTETPTPLRVLRPDLPAGIEAAVAKGLAKTPGDRYPNCGAFAAALQAGSVASDAVPTVQVARPTARPRRLGRRFLGATAVLLVAALAVALVLRSGPRGPIEGTAIQVTTSGHAYAPILSPDGSQIAYDDIRCDTPANCISAVVVREIGSDESRTVIDSLNDALPYQWTDDGRWLLVSTSGGKLPAGQYAISRLGERFVSLGQGTAIFLPGSDTIARAALNDGHRDHPVVIQTMPAPWTQVVDSVRIAPPGDHLYLTAYRRTPEGHWWVYGWTHERSADGVLSTYDGAGHLLDSVSAPGVIFFRWSPTGRAIIVPRDNGAGALNSFLRIAFDPATGRFGRRDTLAFPSGVNTPGIYDLTPDGRTLAYQSRHLAEAKIVLLDHPDDGRRREIPVISATNPLNPAITPDGRAVVYRSASPTNGDGTVRWWIVDSAGSEPRPLTPPFRGSYPSTLTNDALYRVAYDSGHGSSVVRIALADGGSRTVLHGLGPIADIAVGRDGRILLIRVPGDSAFLYDTTGMIVARAGIPDSVGSFAAALTSPAGDEFALSANSSATSVGPDGNVEARIFVLSARTGQFRTMTTLRVVGFSPVAWAADGSFRIQALRGRDPRTYDVAVDPRGGRQTTLGPVKDGECAPSQDLLRAVCARFTWVSDIFVLRMSKPLQ